MGVFLILSQAPHMSVNRFKSSNKASLFELIPMQSYRIEEDRVIVQEYLKFKDDLFYSEYLLADIFFPIDASFIDLFNKRAL